MYEENLPYIRAAYQLRYRLMPTLYSLMYESNQNGMPAWRPLFLEFPDDPKCYTDKNLTFMFGKSILVANVVEKGATTRTIYLPAGCTWYDMNDDLRAYEGGQTIEIPVTLASIPMFLRGSAVVVTTEDVKHILKDTMRQIDLLVATRPTPALCCTMTTATPRTTKTAFTPRPPSRSRPVTAPTSVLPPRAATLPLWSA